MAAKKKKINNKMTIDKDTSHF